MERLIFIGYFLTFAISVKCTVVNKPECGVPFTCSDACKIVWLGTCPSICDCPRPVPCPDIPCPADPPICIVYTKHNGCQSCACQLPFKVGEPNITPSSNFSLIIASVLPPTRIVHFSSTRPTSRITFETNPTSSRDGSFTNPSRITTATSTAPSTTTLRTSVSSTSSTRTTTTSILPPITVLTNFLSPITVASSFLSPNTAPTDVFLPITVSTNFLSPTTTRSIFIQTTTLPATSLSPTTPTTNFLSTFATSTKGPFRFVFGEQKKLIDINNVVENNKKERTTTTSPEEIPKWTKTTNKEFEQFDKPKREECNVELKNEIRDRYDVLYQEIRSRDQTASLLYPAVFQLSKQQLQDRCQTYKTATSEISFYAKRYCFNNYELYDTVYNTYSYCCGYGTELYFFRFYDCLSSLHLDARVKSCDTTLASATTVNLDICPAYDRLLSCVYEPVVRNCGYDAWEIEFQYLSTVVRKYSPGCYLHRINLPLKQKP